MKTLLAELALMFAIGAVACSISENDRCGDGFSWKDLDGGGGVCIPDDTDTTTASGTDTDTGSGPDVDGGDGGNDLPTCLGDACYDAEAGCPGCEASGCVYYAGIIDPGYCTVEDCTVTPDNCPAGYRCCDLPAMLADTNACLKQADYDMASNAGMCSGG